MMLESSIIKTEVKQRALKAVFEKSISKLSVEFLDMLAFKKRESILEAVANSFPFALLNSLKLWDLFFVHYQDELRSCLWIGRFCLHDHDVGEQAHIF